MKAIICTHFGGPETLQLTQAPDPCPHEDELLIRIHAAAVNSADGRMRALDAPGLLKLIMRLTIGWNHPRRPVLGNVFAGIVERVGAKASGFQPGDRVYGSTGFQCGCYAEKIAVKAGGSVAHMPKNARFEEAAALPFGGQTALHFLRKGKMQPDEDALVYGASGAVGTMATQILHLQGINVTAACSSSNQELARALGADRVLAYDTEAFSKDTQRYKLIFDCVGLFAEKNAKARLAPGGKYVTVGGMDVAKELKSDLEALAAWYEQGKLKAVIDRVYPLEHVEEAHRYLDTKRKRGNLILTLE